MPNLRILILRNNQITLLEALNKANLPCLSEFFVENNFLQFIDISRSKNSFEMVCLS